MASGFVAIATPSKVDAIPTNAMLASCFPAGHTSYGVIWLAVVTLLLYATRRARAVVEEQFAGRLSFWGGAIIPSLLLLLLLAHTLWLMQVSGYSRTRTNAQN